MISRWYRVAQTENLEHVFSGDGGLYVAGRWNYKGRKIVYCSQSIALCTLEWLSHNGLSVSGFSYDRFSIDIPSELILKLSITELPKAWNKTPSMNETRDFSEKILFNQRQYMALSLPSVMVPEEQNLIINPMHSAYEEIQRSIRSLGRFVAAEREITHNLFKHHEA